MGTIGDRSTRLPRDKGRARDDRGREPRDVGGLVDCAVALVLDEDGEAERFPVPRRLDREHETLRRRALAQFDQLVFRLTRREPRHERLARVLARRHLTSATTASSRSTEQTKSGVCSTRGVLAATLTTAVPESP